MSQRPDPYQTSIEELMESPVTLPETAPASEVLGYLGRSPSGAVLITDAGSRVLRGIFTKDDLIKFEKSPDVSSLRASDIENRSWVGIRPSGTVAQALRIFDGDNPSNAKFSVLPVVDPDFRVLGVLTRARLNKFLGSFQQYNAPGSSFSY